MNTKRILLSLVVVVTAVAPALAHASVFVARDEYSVGPQAQLDGNLYVASNTVSVGAPVRGDAFLAGNTVSLTNTVSDDVTAAGSTVQILAPVGGDVRVGGGQVAISSSVTGDVIAAGGTVHILNTAQIFGDVYVAGGQVIIDGVVRGSVHFKGGSLAINNHIFGSVKAHADKHLTLGSGALIEGTLSYTSKQTATIDPAAKVGGAVTYTPRESRHGDDRGWSAGVLALVGIVTALKTLALLGAAAVVVWRWRRQAGEAAQDVKDNFWSFAGKGIVYGFLVPMAAFMLLISFVGSIVGILAFMAYGAVIMVSKVFSGLLLGAWLSALIYKRPALHVTWANAFAGVILLELLSLIPIIGWILKALICLAAFGIVAHRTQEAIRRT